MGMDVCEICGGSCRGGTFLCLGCINEQLSESDIDEILELDEEDF